MKGKHQEQQRHWKKREIKGVQGRTGREIMKNRARTNEKGLIKGLILRKVLPTKLVHSPAKRSTYTSQYRSLTSQIVSGVLLVTDFCLKM